MIEFISSLHALFYIFFFQMQFYAFQVQHFIGGKFIVADSAICEWVEKPKSRQVDYPLKLKNAFLNGPIFLDEV